MKTFTSVEEAFKWWLENIYRGLPADQKKGKLVTAWRDFTHKRGISEKRMIEILGEFGQVDVKTIVNFTPK